jgi:hypothetical protein
MYSETDLESAVAAGAISPDAAKALRTHVAAQRATPMVDEESFRLLTGFNDIFVAIAGVLLLVGAGWIGGEFHPAVGAGAVAGLAWGLAEYFTRVRRMALPSILFLLAFVGGVFAFAAAILIGDNNQDSDGPNTVQALLLALSAAIAAGAATFHWRRFKVPITIAAGVAALSGMALALVLAAVPGIEEAITPLIFVIGLGVFGFAMRWDMSDTKRETRRSDVAFWLHLLAAPMLVHPIFWALGLLDGAPGIGEAFVVIGVYVAMGLIALAIDRRALLVSALGYVLYAIGALFREFGAVSLNVALTAFVIGSALLLLSAFWHKARGAVLGRVPAGLGARLPAFGQAA